MSRNARDFYSIKRDLLREGRLFVDEEFPASNRSIVNNTAVPTEPPAKTVIWKRPKVRHHAIKSPPTTLIIEPWHVNNVAF